LLFNVLHHLPAAQVVRVLAEPLLPAQLVAFAGLPGAQQGKPVGGVTENLVVNVCCAVHGWAATQVPSSRACRRRQASMALDR